MPAVGWPPRRSRSRRRPPGSAAARFPRPRRSARPRPTTCQPRSAAAAPSLFPDQHSAQRPAEGGQMTNEELLSQLYDKTLVGNGPAVLELTNTGLAAGLGPETLLYEALIPSLEEVGARFERGDFFVPEMLI